MEKLLAISGSIAALIGILLCLAAGLSRLAGLHYVVGYEADTLFSVGTGLMVFACLARLQQLLSRTGD